ncbi:MAG: mechanosensitive ion channel family protein [Candidatus Aenigmarchaeota archaeon]|nr:mechanosensitive ion channel family protein [Candidatus Aenigmarchaeota archaeon]
MALEVLFQNEYTTFLSIMATAVIVATAFDFVLRNYAKKLAAKTKSELDDAILHIIERPLYLLIMLAGLYFAAKQLPILAPYAVWLDEVFFTAAVLLVALMVSRIAEVLVSHWLKVRRRYEKMPRLISKVIAVFIYLIAFITILGYFNVEITPLIAALGLGGLALGLALQSTLTNFFAGLHILSDKPVSVGNFIEVENGTISGFVEDIGWRSTRIRTLHNTIVIVPNARLAESVITNYSLPDSTNLLRIECGVAYDSNLDRVEKAALDVARKAQKGMAGLVKGAEPAVRFHTFGDSNINFRIVLVMDDFEQRGRITHEFIKALKARFDKEKIEISWPVRKVYYGK